MAGVVLCGWRGGSWSSPPEGFRGQMLTVARHIRMPGMFAQNCHKPAMPSDQASCGAGGGKASPREQGEGESGRADG